jgi:hypothetical protein
MVIVSLVAAGAMTVYSGIFRNSQYTELKNELEQHRQRLREQVSCARTAVQCTAPNTYVAVRNLSDAVIVPNGGVDGTTVGSYAFRARCTGAATFVLERRLRPNLVAGNAKLAMLGADWGELFKPGTDPCAASAPLRVVSCPAGQYLKGLNLDTGVPSCSAPNVALSNCFFWSVGPFDHCFCPGDHVMVLHDASVPVPSGMLFQASCTCCRISVTVP